MTLRLPLVLGSILALVLAGCGSESPSCVPSPEVCDGSDNNCDGMVDEGFDVGAACTAGVGACQRSGVKVCAQGGAGTVCNAVPGAPSAETCNGIDDDCDGQVDQGVPDCCTPSDTRPCGTTMGVCVAGTQTCSPARAWGTCLDGGGQPVVLPGQNAETCNGLDDDCDGQTDEGFDVGAACNSGVGACLASGVKVCKQDGTATVCDAVPGSPSPEVCNGIDDDCNGAVDDGLGTITCGLGACTMTVAACANGVPATCTPGAGTPEVCNGVDDDCNGSIDDGLGTITCGVGACSRTVAACASGAPGTCVPGSPTPELCNGIDDDCNGVVDRDAFPDLGTACTVGVGACARPGVKICATNQLGTVCGGATPGTPTPEVCDGVDNDCDGVVDNGNPGGGVACTTGLLGVCSPGVTHCVGGTITCAQNVSPSSEVCDGLDNDCNGVVDEGDPGGGAACTTGQLGVCAAGTRHCQSGSLACVANVAPSTEICDGLDNNCNGVVDEGDPGGGAACTTGLPGVCSAGTTHCQSGALVCAQNVTPSPEVCNGLDDDCDGLVDAADVPIDTLCPPTANVATTDCPGAAGCRVATCQPGWADLNGIYSDGCESPI